jgi:hypothetical protein
VLDLRAPAAPASQASGDAISSDVVTGARLDMRPEPAEAVDPAATLVVASGPPPDEPADPTPSLPPVPSVVADDADEPAAPALSGEAADADDESPPSRPAEASEGGGSGELEEPDDDAPAAPEPRPGRVPAGRVTRR